MPAPLPWFPFYVDDWETDERLTSLSLVEQGALLCLMRWQWREGSISDSPAIVAAKLSVRAANGQLSPGKRTAIAKRLLRDFFVKCGEGAGRVVYPALVEVYAKQTSRSETAARVAREAAAKRRAIAEQSPRGRRANAGRSLTEVEVRSQIEKSLKASAHAENDSNGGAHD